MEYLIIANGPFISDAFIKAAAKNVCIVALDGAANKLLSLNILPDMIIGDFDSFQEEACLSSVKKVKLVDQNFSDFQKALKYLKKNATRIDVVCATGGRMDHEQANIRALISEYSEICPIYLHNDEQTLEFVRDKIIHITGKHHDYCGLFGMPEATMIVKNSGLEYGSDAPYRLTLTQGSSSNRLMGNDGAIIEIQGSALVARPSILRTTRMANAC